MKSAIVIAFLLLFLTCMNQPTRRTGKELAEVYCVTCHQLPTPQDLDQSTWETYVLPRMKQMMGVAQTDRSELFENGEGRRIVEQAQVFPTKSDLTEKEFDQIAQYFINTAPEKLVDERPHTIVSSQFEMKMPDYRLSPPSTIMLKLMDDRLFVGDVNSNGLLLFDRQLQLEQLAKVGSGAVDIAKEENAYYVTVMGSFSPTDVPGGYVLKLPLDRTQQPKKVIPNLRRPVQSKLADVNHDGLLDICVAEFGKWTGGINWYKNTGNDRYEKQELLRQSGVIGMEIVDMDSDGLKDILALFGQGNEGFWAFINQGNGQFESKQVLSLPPTYGSSTFQLIDWNNDEHPDILYTAGDNADYPPIIKPYQGIYVFVNDGEYQFQEDYFFPFPGAYGAEYADFDGDGDKDLVSISFFPDYRDTSDQSVILLRRNEQGQFNPEVVNTDFLGRWIVMESGDLDGDLDIDILLGSLTFEVVNSNVNHVQSWVEKGIPYLVLENMQVE